LGHPEGPSVEGNAQHPEQQREGDPDVEQYPAELVGPGPGVTLAISRIEAFGRGGEGQEIAAGHGEDWICATAGAAAPWQVEVLQEAVGTRDAKGLSQELIIGMVCWRGRVHASLTVWIVDGHDSV